MIFWLSVFLSLLCILFAESVSSSEGRNSRTCQLNKLDILFFLSSWQVFNLGYWQNYIANPVSEYSYNISATLLILFTLWYALRRKINLGLKFSGQDFAKGFLVLAIFAGIAIPIGLKRGFLHFNPRLDFQYALSTMVGYYFFTAPSEELIFRGIIQNLLKRSMMAWLACLITSVLFATIYSHLTGNGIFPNWEYAGFAFIAGLAYGISYLWTKNILVPIALHGTVDTIWRIFLS